MLPRWGWVGKAALLTLAVLFGSPGSAAPLLFGYVGITCGLDDPHDDSALTDYSAEVAGFTNANHICLLGDPATWADQIRRADAQFRPMIGVEPLFDLAGDGPEGAAAAQMWRWFLDAVRDSGVDPARLILYLVDEPTLRAIPPETVTLIAAQAAADLPQAGRMLVEACGMEGPPPVEPLLTLWGFDCYTFRDPGADPLFMTFLRLSIERLHDGQDLVLVLDANHTPTHADAGLTPDDMADVARAYARLARAEPRVAAVIGYTWAGGIDGDHERGARDLGPSVIAAHHEIGLMLMQD
jgi:hypothetical protein